MANRIALFVSRSRQKLVDRWSGYAVLLGAGLLGAALISAVISACGSGVDNPNPSATLAAEDRLETGLQGEVPLADQQSGRSATGYQKGMKLIGTNTLLDRGGNMQMTRYKNCAYVDQGAATLSNHPLEGMAVLDVSDAANLKLVSIISSPTGFNAWEGLEASPARGFLLVFAGSRTNPILGEVPPVLQGAIDDAFDIYDVSQDCTKPVRIATFSTREVLPGGIHGLRIAPDGKTAYISTLQQEAAPASQASLIAVDLSDLTSPKLIATWKWQDNPAETIAHAFHDGDISPDGTRLYWGSTAELMNNLTDRNGVEVFDISSIQNRSASPSFVLLGSVYWNDCSPQGHTVQYAKINGAPYVFAGAECTGNQLHVIPVSDPSNLKIVATFGLQSSDPANAKAMAADGVLYQAHYTGVDNVDNATTLFVTWYGSGLRALDIRDPLHIKEFAYLNPPAHPNVVFCGVACESAAVKGNFGPSGNQTKYEMVMSDVKYDSPTGNIWFAGVDGGLYVAHLTSTAGPNGL